MVIELIENLQKKGMCFGSIPKLKLLLSWELEVSILSGK